MTTLLYRTVHKQARNAINKFFTVRDVRWGSTYTTIAKHLFPVRYYLAQTYSLIPDDQVQEWLANLISVLGFFTRVDVDALDSTIRANLFDVLINRPPQIEPITDKNRIGELLKREARKKEKRVRLTWEETMKKYGIFKNILAGNRHGRGYIPTGLSRFLGCTTDWYIRIKQDVDNHITISASHNDAASTYPTASITIKHDVDISPHRYVVTRCDFAQPVVREQLKGPNKHFYQVEDEDRDLKEQITLHLFIAFCIRKNLPQANLYSIPPHTSNIRIERDEQEIKLYKQKKHTYWWLHYSEYKNIHQAISTLMSLLTEYTVNRQCSLTLIDEESDQ